MAERPLTEQRSGGFQRAIDDLTEGLSGLVRQHFELARSEVRHTADQLSDHLVVIAIFGPLALIGYLMLNIAIIALAFWLGGVAAMAITALVLAGLQLIGGGIPTAIAARRLQNSQFGLQETSQEIQKDKQWLKEIRDNSADKRLPNQTS